MVLTGHLGICLLKKMDEDIHFNENQRNYAKEISSYSFEQIEKLERVCNALERRYNAEASKEAHQKFRILFQRAAKEWLPFIIYCLTFAPVAVASVWRIVELQGKLAVLGWVGLIIVMALPAVFMPLFRKKNEEKE